jgi:long-chain acyl-CoA synthetase
MSIEFLTQRFEENRGDNFIVWGGTSYTYQWLLDAIGRWQDVLSRAGIDPGCVVVLEADFSPNSVALFLALTQRSCIVVPLSKTVASRGLLTEAARGEVSIILDESDRGHITMLPHAGNHELYDRLRAGGSPGLILFSSGSTGEPKASLHDLSKIMSKFQVRRHRRRMLAFLLFDHIGGVNTLLYSLSNAGCLITAQDRSPDNVLRLIEEHKVELLPTSPTFLNLVLLSGAYKSYDLSSLSLVTYGTESMPASTLATLNKLFPQVEFLQTYGLSEVGILRSKSRSSDSLWVKVGGEGFDTRVVDGVLQIKAASAMLGYLNAPSPFTEDGWFITGDEVEVDGDYIKILGRKSEMINVGGQKVFPAEVESVLRTAGNVAEAIVYGEQFPIVGNIVCADVRPVVEEESRAFALRLKKHCQGSLEDYKIPVKIKIVSEKQYTERYKTIRRVAAVTPSRKPKLAFVFAGQGPRWPGTCRELLDKSPVFRSAVEECEKGLRGLAGWSVLEEMTKDVSASLLVETGVAQPANFVVQVALIALWRSWGVVPNAVVGHSMGEVAAAYCAGALTLDDALRVVYHRGRVTQKAAGLGKMAWAVLSLDEANEMLEGWEDRLSVAANNEPTTTVIAGDTKALQEFLKLLRARGVPHQLLSFGHGFHSPLMTKFQEELVSELKGIRPQRTKLPIVSTVTGDFTFGPAFDKFYWGRNIRETVLFAGAIKRLADSGFEAFLEISPHALLTGSVSQCLAHWGHLGTVLHSLHREGGDLAELKQTLAVLNSLGIARETGQPESGVNS